MVVKVILHNAFAQFIFRQEHTLTAKTPVNGMCQVYITAILLDSQTEHW